MNEQLLANTNVRTLEQLLLDKVKTFASKREETISHDKQVELYAPGVENMGFCIGYTTETTYETVTHIEKNPIPLYKIFSEANASPEEADRAVSAVWSKLLKKPAETLLDEACANVFAAEMSKYFLQKNLLSLPAIIADASPAGVRQLRNSMMDISYVLLSRCAHVSQ